MKVSSIEVLRGFAVSIVIFYHMYAVQDRYFGENILPDIFRLGGWGVDIFFVISGVVMFKSVYGRKTRITSWPFLRARVSRIYPPYWVITLIILGIAFVQPGLVNSSYDQSPSILRSLLLFPDVTNPWLNVGWSLIYEMWFYLLLGFLLLFRKPLAIALLCAYGMLLIVVPDLSNLGPVLGLVTDPLILEFLVGFALGAVFFHPDLPRKHIILVTIGAISLVLFAAVLASGVDLSQSRFERFVTYGFAGISTVAIVLCLENRITQSALLRPLIYVGTVSYSVYLTHVLFLNLFLVATLRILNLGLSPIVANIACYVFVLLAGSVYYRIVERTLSDRFAKVLNPSRGR